MDIFQKLMKQLEQKIIKSSILNIVNRFVIFMSIFSSSCGFASPGSQALEKFQGQFRKEIEKEYGVQTYGIGSSFPLKINSMLFCFSTGKEGSLEKGREIAVSIAHRFIQRMNEDENLLKFLANNPANLINVDLRIRFKDSLESPLQSVMVVGSKNLVVYNKYDEENHLIDLHRETFDEAERIVQKSPVSPNKPLFHG